VGRCSTVADGDHVALRPADLVARSGHAEELALVGAAHRPDAERRVGILRNVLDLEVSVREGAPQALHEFDLTFGAGRRSGKS
jgi:hypothetical protein